MPSFAQILIALGAAGSALAAPLANTSAAVTTEQRSAGQTFTGDITYYQPGLGACGETSSDSETVVALSPTEYDGNCGKTITITKDGQTATAKVVDKCPSCASGAIDVSSTVFKSLADMSVGRTQVSWSFN
ncbi:RlpA-like double-psi beta-barrel-protein domain-containing protein-containing protein [Xylaria bambusicola]|uniref:RlpA-like double-psi beta-barrel-protein domain-containing protein-containing protein n=1 Tax=Xylaria bambusicola TaxID=326684 RepID=UPI0020080438|nr:RlpA-like double-psi beta-barrel-protein domain-containing protein-containing protein [Xylaria bambusicola]KAI0509372.1 RlpA-like double-psi beta-barrel-protein domain-containing protein-containing protein [Xylaria bambusicola]